MHMECPHFMRVTVFTHKPNAWKNMMLKILEHNFTHTGCKQHTWKPMQLWTEHEKAWANTTIEKRNNNQISQLAI